MKKFITIVSLFFSFGLFGQKDFNVDSLKLCRKSSAVLLGVSVFPHFIAYQSIFSPRNQNPSPFYGSVWFGVGLTLDISAIDFMIKTKKLKKLN